MAGRSVRAPGRTGDDERHGHTPSPATVAAVVALAIADTLVLWHPEGPALLAAKILGRMSWIDLGRMSWIDRVEQQRQASASQRPNGGRPISLGQLAGKDASLTIVIIRPEITRGYSGVAIDVLGGVVNEGPAFLTLTAGEN